MREIGVGCAIYFLAYQSIVVITLMSISPALVFVGIATYQHCVYIDWHLLQPPQHRTPPMANPCYACWTCGLPVEDYQVRALQLLAGF